MKFKGLFSMLVVLGMLCFVQSASALPVEIYSTDFESGASVPPWSNGNIAAPNRGVDSYYHGNYSQTGSTTLTLTNLPTHTQLALEFDLYLFYTWDGNDTYYGPDWFSLSGDINEAWTFTNHQTEGQTYPGTPDLIPYGSGSSATHVYLGLDPTGTGDEFLIDHVSDMFTVTFGGPTTQSDEWWGIDNVRVSVDEKASAVPEPASMLLLGSGLAGLAGFRKKLKV